jgi:hypothetical protein
MRIGTAMASRISHQMAKSRCAREWGGWGRLSDDGPGQHNPDRSEGPWGRAAGSARTEVPYLRIIPDTAQGVHGESRGHEGRKQTRALGKASSDSPALKPYWGKPAARNFRRGDGNVGIMRSPVRAIALPDNRHEAEKGKFLRERSSDPLGRESCAATARDTVKRRQGFVLVVDLFTSLG